MIKLQYRTFREQCLTSLVIYVPTLAFCMYKINVDKMWAYDSNVILLNADFNLAMGVTMGMGIMSFALSYKPNWFKLVT